MASNKMPPELLEKFQKKNEAEKGAEEKGGDKDAKAKRMEALRKARKVKSKK